MMSGGWRKELNNCIDKEDLNGIRLVLSQPRAKSEFQVTTQWVGNDWSDTPLHRAVKYHSPEVTEELLKISIHSWYSSVFIRGLFCSRYVFLAGILVYLFEGFFAQDKYF